MGMVEDLKTDGKLEKERTDVQMQSARRVYKPHC
jgi:hypothetical protein